MIIISMGNKYLIDADLYIGLYNKDDAHHLQAIDTIHSLGDKDPIYHTTWDVIDEVSTKLSYFGQKVDSTEFLSDLINTDTNVLFPDDEILQKTIDLFKKIKTKHVSFTDCVNMVWARKLKIDKILSFDKIYKKQGFDTI